MPIDATAIADQLLLGRYRVLEERGRGGFGRVSVCWDPRLMRRVAIKTIPLHMAEPVVKRGEAKAAKPKRKPRNTPMAGAAAAQPPIPGFPGQFATGQPPCPDAPGSDPQLAQKAEHDMLLRAALAETRTASLLAHPNIVSMLDFESDEENAYIIMEYVEGASLAELLDATEDGLLTADEAAAIVEGVCEALQCAHDNGVLHLDIKPDNILVEMSGRVKLADFGMAALSSVTGYTGARGGTVGYMPPEQISCTGVDVRTDVFAFASVMYEALTGVRPFAADKLSRSLELVLAGAVDPCALNEDVSPQVADALLVALSPNPEDRPTSAEALADELLAGLGRPKAGRKSLATFVADVLDDSRPAEEADDAESLLADSPFAGYSPAEMRELGPLSRSFPRLAPQLMRGLAAFSSGAVAAAAVHWLIPTNPPAAGIVAAAAVIGLGVAAPALGYALALASLVIACLAARLWVFAALLALLGAAWWLLAARTRPIGSAGVLANGFGSALPFPALFGGYLLPAGHAALAALVGFAACGALACIGGGQGGAPAFSLAADGGGRLAQIQLEASLAADPQAALAEALTPAFHAQVLLGSAAFWLTGAAWTGAAAVMGALCHGGSKTRCYLGCTLSGIVLVAFGLVIARMENGGSWSGLAPEVAVGAIGSTILMGLCVFMLGSPRALNVDGADEPPADWEVSEATGESR